MPTVSIATPFRSEARGRGCGKRRGWLVGVVMGTARHPLPARDGHRPGAPDAQGRDDPLGEPIGRNGLTRDGAQEALRLGTPATSDIDARVDRHAEATGGSARKGGVSARGGIVVGVMSASSPSP
jgi:hypothetical protein